MAGYNRIFVDVDDFYELRTSYSTVNGIWLNPMEYMAIHDGTDLGLQTISLQGVELTEVAFASLDLIGSVGKYTVDPTTNSIILIVAKGDVSTNELAIDYIVGHLLKYQTKTLEYYSTDALYTMDTYAADGTFIGSTQASSTSVLVSKMLVLDGSQNVNSTAGWYYHNLRRALQVQI